MSRSKYTKKKRKLSKKYHKSLFRFTKGGDNSPKHSQILDYLFDQYKKNPDFASEPLIHQFINQNYAPPHTGFNQKKHLELLRLIAFQIEKKSNTPQYLEFLKTLFFSLLEEPGISHQHTLSRQTHPALYKKLNEIDSIYSPYSNSFLFNDPQRGLSISNTQLHQLTEILETKKRKRKEGPYKTKQSPNHKTQKSSIK